MIIAVSQLGMNDGAFHGQIVPDGGQQSVLLLLFEARVEQLLKGCCGVSVTLSVGAPSRV